MRSPRGKGAYHVPLSGESTCGSASPSDAGARVLPFIVLLAERACKGRSYAIPFNEATFPPRLWVVFERARERGAGNGASLPLFCGMMADVATDLVASGAVVRPCARAPKVQKQSDDEKQVVIV